MIDLKDQMGDISPGLAGSHYCSFTRVPKRGVEIRTEACRRRDLVEMELLQQAAAASLSLKPGASKGIAFPSGLLKTSIGNQNQKPNRIDVWEVQLAGFSPSDRDWYQIRTAKELDDQ